MKITIKDLKLKNAPILLINFFKKDDIIKNNFGKKIYELKIYDIIAFYCIHWFIKTFRYKKIKSIRFINNKKWYRYSYNFLNEDLEYTLDNYQNLYRYIKINKYGKTINVIKNY